MRTRYLPRILQGTAERFGMFAPGQTVVVGASGGADSTALLHALAGLRSVWNLRIVAAHLNHGFRGAEADGDAEYVATLADRLEIACAVERIDVPAWKKKQRVSAQEAARTARHAFLRRVAAAESADRIALGHTQDDRTETVLLNLLRGTGAEGLQGFPPVAPPIVRPLYDVRRHETEAYCAAQQLAPRRDSSNDKTDYRRNHLRLELLPLLTSYYNLNVSDAVLRMSALVSADNSLLEKLAGSVFPACLSAQDESGLALDCKKLNALDIALRRRVLRQAIAAVRGDLQNIGLAVIDAALHYAERQTDFAQTLPDSDAGEVRIILRGQALRVEKIAPLNVPLAWAVALIPGAEDWAEQLAARGWRLELREFPNGAAAQQWIDTNETADSAREALRNATLIALPAANLSLPLTARSWRPGDRMTPTGMTGTKKLQDVFTDAKIPAAQRDRFPVLADTDGTGAIFAVVGLRTSEHTVRGFSDWPAPLWLLRWRRLPDAPK